MNSRPTPLLPDVDAVEVVGLRGIEPDRHGYMPHAKGAPFATLLGPDAERIASLWRQLPPGEQMRCHTPPFGLRFFSRGKLLFEAFGLLEVQQRLGPFRRRALVCSVRRTGSAGCPSGPPTASS